MSLEISIGKNTSTETIEKEWLGNGDQDIVFNITNKSSFQLFGEGAAIGYLAELADCNNIYIKFPYVELSKIEQQIKGLPPIMSSIFGLELLHICQGVSLKDQEASQDLKNKIGSYLWKGVQEKGGVISSGKQNYLISRHAYEVPRQLRENPSVISFPALSFFTSAITPLILKLRGKKELGAAEKILIEWIHQISENAFQHGASNTEKKSVEGYSGIILQKFIFNKKDISKAEILKRDEFSGKIKEYIIKVIEDQRWKDKKVIVNSVTVCDLGIGIQNTLVDEQGSFDDLNSAFVDGVTQKKVTNKEAGFGLGQALNAAKNLKAMLYVISSNLVGFLDLSVDKNDRTSPLEYETSLFKKTGTSISLIWVTVADL